MDTWERFSRALEEAKRVDEECGCEESDTKSKKKITDLRGMRTDINNVKNRLRSMGLKMSQELEGELVDEGKSDKKLPDHKRSAARLARYDNPSGALALGGGQQRARRTEHEERRGVKKEDFEIEEGMSLKDFKTNRRNIKRREASADAKSRGHVSKNIVTHGKTYSSDEAKSGRANMSDNERATRKSVAMNPDQVGDTRETSDKTKNTNKLRKQKAMGELG